MSNGSVLRILDCYVETNVLSFSDLCKQAGYPTDLGGYYIRHLIDAKCLVRTTRGQYEITPHGKQRLISLKRQQGRPMAAHARLCVMVIVKYGEKFVVVRRKRQPFIGFVEWPAMMLTPGESLDDSARQLLDTRLSIATPAHLVGFFRQFVQPLAHGCGNDTSWGYTTGCHTSSNHRDSLHRAEMDG